MDYAALPEWDVLQPEHARLEAELERLRKQTPDGNEERTEPFDKAAHEALWEELEAHRARIADWRRRHAIGPLDPDPAP